MRHPELRYTSPNRFTLKQRFGLSVIPPLVALVLKALMASGNRRVEGIERYDSAIQDHRRVIVAIWHECMGLAAWHFRNTGFHTLTSYSFDGEMAARVTHQFGLPALRGSSSRGGREALHQLRKALDMDITVGFTLDGPRGPRRVAKGGASMLSALTGVPIVPMAFGVHPSWRLGSWDRFPVPKPRCQLGVRVGEPITAPAERTRDGLENHRVQVEAALNSLHQELETSLGCTPESLRLEKTSET